MIIIERPLRHGDRWQGKPTGPLEPIHGVAHAMGWKILINEDVLDYYGAKAGTHDEVVYAAEWLDRIGYSAHWLVAPGGEAIHCRREDQVAWHCKANGRNWDSIGIEFLVRDALTYDDLLEAMRADWLSTSQYETGVELFSRAAREYGWTGNYLSRHSDEDGGKHDPGDGFPWDDFVSDVRRRV